jgi:hypothetical protein
MAVHAMHALDPGLTVYCMIGEQTAVRQCLTVTSVIEGTGAFNIAYGR